MCAIVSNLYFTKYYIMHLFSFFTIFNKIIIKKNSAQIQFFYVWAILTRMEKKTEKI